MVPATIGVWEILRPVSIPHQPLSFSLRTFFESKKMILRNIIWVISSVHSKICFIAFLICVLKITLDKTYTNINEDRNIIDLLSIFVCTEVIRTQYIVWIVVGLEFPAKIKISFDMLSQNIKWKILLLLEWEALWFCVLIHF